jgi:predicted TIM-barrel fold metal-dependent hydrolase
MPTRESYWGGTRMAKNGFRVMDSDLHVMEPSDLWKRYIDPPFRDRAPRIVRVSGESRVGQYLFEGKVFPTCDVNARERYLGMGRRTDLATAPMRARGYDAVSQLQAMDQEGIDAAVLYPTAALYIPLGMNDVDPRLSAAVCRAYNNWLHDFCLQDPKRLKVAAMLPVHDVAEAALEARRAVAELGAIAAYMRPNFVNGRLWHDRYFDPLWALFQEMNVPVGFHEGTGSDSFQDGAEFGENRLMRHACSHPIGMMKAMLSLICGGVFERFPRLRVGFLEANTGWVPFWLARMERDLQLYREWDAPFLKMRPREYFERNCWVGCEGEEKELSFVVQEIGDANIVFSTDYPHHDSEFPHSVREFLKLPIPETSKRKILWDNCARFYGLDG